MASSAVEPEEEELPLPSFTELFGEGETEFWWLIGHLSFNAVGIASKKRRRTARDNEETSGRWTPEEHRLFLEGVLQFGRDWKRIQALIRTRSLVQIRTHAQKVFKKVAEKKRGSTGAELQVSLCHMVVHLTAVAAGPPRLGWQAGSLDQPCLVSPDRIHAQGPR